jgi:hypothetical protein
MPSGPSQIHKNAKGLKMLCIQPIAMSRRNERQCASGALRHVPFVDYVSGFLVHLWLSIVSLAASLAFDYVFSFMINTVFLIRSQVSCCISSF